MLEGQKGELHHLYMSLLMKMNGKKSKIITMLHSAKGIDFSGLETKKLMDFVEVINLVIGVKFKILGIMIV
jgi:hypothetical protein